MREVEGAKRNRRGVGKGIKSKIQKKGDEKAVEGEEE